MAGRTSRTKGHGYEREVARELRHLFPAARRHLEYQDGEAFGVDLANTGRLAIQVKRWRNYAPVSTIFEIKAPGHIPVVVTRGDRQEAMAILPWSDLLDIIAGVVDVTESIADNGTTVEEGGQHGNPPARPD